MKHRFLRRFFRHDISQNVLALGWIQVATFVVPLITVPYVSRVLGPSEFGLVIFAQSFAIFLTLFVDWGFSPYGTRAVAAARNDPEALATIVARIRGAQLLMSVASVPIALGALVLVPKFQAHPLFLFLAWVAAVTSALAPTWYFVGVERIKVIALVGLVIRLIAAGLTFVFVKGPSDGWIWLMLFAAGSVGVWVASDAMLYRRVRFRLRGMRAAGRAVVDSGRVFVGTVGVSLYSDFNVVLLGLFVPSAQVAAFGAGERLVRSSEQMLGPVATAVYPRLAFLQSSGRHDRARRLIAIAFLAVAGVAALLAALFAIFAPTWVGLLFGHKFVHSTVPVMRILVLLIPSNLIGGVAAVWLMTLHRDRTLFWIAVCSGVLNVGLGSAMSILFGAKGMAWSVVTAQFLASGAGLIAVYLIRDEQTALFTRRHRRGGRVAATSRANGANARLEPGWRVALSSRNLAAGLPAPIWQSAVRRTSQDQESSDMLETEVA